MAFTQSVRTRLQQTSRQTYIILFVLVWLIAATAVWFHVVYQSPERVFKGMLRNNFATTGYTQATSSNQGNVTSQEVSQLQLGGDGLIQAVTTLTQEKDKVVTETITTKDKQYVRYDDIVTNRTGKDGKPLKFDKVIGVWASTATQTQSAGANQATAQLMLGLIPIGNVSPQDRHDLLKFIETKKPITANYKTVKKETKNGRLVYTYEVKIDPVPYLEMLKKYGKAAGLGEQVASLNPSDYASTPATTVQVTVDARSRHIVSLVGPGEAVAAQKYSGFGIKKDVQIPSKTITTDELQQRLGVQ